MAGKDRRAGRPLKRPVGIRTPRKTLFVVCEGKRTEPEYLNALKREPSVRDVAAVDLRIESGIGSSVPLTLVSRSSEARRRALDEEGEIDEFWCVFDVEWPTNHPDIPQAVEMARKNEIHLAISNPCFEVWLILHFQAHNRWLNNVDARRLRQKLDGAKDKGLDAAAYMKTRGAASHRAAKLDEQHARNGLTFPEDNPSSGMHRLLLSVEPSRP